MLRTPKQLNLLTQERFFFGDNTLPHLSSAIPYFVKEIEKLVLEGEPISIAFPDDGAHKRFQKYFTNFPIVRCIKRRNGSLRFVEIQEGTISSHNVATDFYAGIS